MATVIEGREPLVEHSCPEAGSGGQPRAPLQSDRHRPGVGPRGALAFSGLLLLGHLPLIIQHFVGVFEHRPHYEFAPLLGLVAATTLWFRWPRIEQQPGASGRICGRLALLTGGVSLTAGVLLNSPWLAAVAAIMNIGGLILLSNGPGAARDLLPCWLLLWLAVPPPMMLDDVLISKLQAITSQLSSQLLNYLGVLHLRNGNVFDLPDRSLFVAEACSGVHSQLVLIALAAVIAVLRRRSAVHGLLLLVAAVCWSLGANLARITIVVTAATHGVDLANGWQHEALGFGLILFGTVGLLSTDHLLFLLLGPISAEVFTELDSADHDRRQIPLWVWIDNSAVKNWNRWVAGQPSESVQQHLQTQATSSQRKLRLLLRPSAIVGLSLFFVTLGAAQVLMAVGTTAEQRVDASGLFEAIPADLMSAQLEGWQRETYGSEQRDLDSREGQFNHHWVYRQGAQQTYFALDLPFVGWHELSDCYVGKGWKVSGRDACVSESGLEYVRVLLNRGAGEYGLLCFSLHRMDGTTVSPQSSRLTLQQKLKTNPLISRMQGQAPVPRERTVIQYQQFRIVSVPPDDTTLEEFGREYQRRLDELRRSSLFSGHGDRVLQLLPATR